VDESSSSSASASSLLDSDSGLPYFRFGGIHTQLLQQFNSCMSTLRVTSQSLEYSAELKQKKRPASKPKPLAVSNRPGTATQHCCSRPEGCLRNSICVPLRRTSQAPQERIERWGARSRYACCRCTCLNICADSEYCLPSRQLSPGSDFIGFEEDNHSERSWLQGTFN